MADESHPKRPSLKIAPGTSEVAPFIYFDGVATYGVNAGAVQMELAANIIMPEGAGTKTDVVITAHLRCSPAAARLLRDCITRALEMPARQEIFQPIPSGKPN